MSTQHQFLKFVTDIHFKIVTESERKTYRCNGDRVKRQTDRQTDRRPGLIRFNIYIYKNTGN